MKKQRRNSGKKCKYCGRFVSFEAVDAQSMIYYFQESPSIEHYHLKCEKKYLQQLTVTNLGQHILDSNKLNGCKG